MSVKVAVDGWFTGDTGNLALLQSEIKSNLNTQKCPLY